MTIETLMHIYNLLQEDFETKDYILKLERKALKEWYEDPDTGEQEYPNEEALEIAKEKWCKGKDALEEFRNKKWN